MTEAEHLDAETELRVLIRMADEDGLTDLAQRLRIALAIILGEGKTPAPGRERPHEPG